MRVGRVSGFELSIHWSTLVIFGFLVLSLSTVRLPEAAAGYSDGAYLAAALVSGLVFYASLLAHEVSHAAMARREGIEVEGLTLWMLGGVARLSGEAPDAGADLRIAGVGPLVSLGLAALFGVVAGILEVLDGSELVGATVAWLAGINLLLAVFNLIPAAPLDGGRILRAALWRMRHDRVSAAVTATKAGMVFGYLLVGLGLVALLTGGIGGLWFVVLGWFVLTAARAEQAQVVLADVLGGLRVRDVMSPDPVTAPDHLTVQQLLDDYVMRTRHSAFPLVDGDQRPSGLITLSQVRAVPAASRTHERVRDVACAMGDVFVAEPSAKLVDVLPLLNRCAQGRSLVLDGDRLVGILTRSDVSRALELASLHGDDARRGRREPLPVASGGTPDA